MLPTTHGAYEKHKFPSSYFSCICSLKQPSRRTTNKANRSTWGDTDLENRALATGTERKSGKGHLNQWSPNSSLRARLGDCCFPPPGDPHVLFHQGSLGKLQLQPFSVAAARRFLVLLSQQAAHTALWADVDGNGGTLGL